MAFGHFFGDATFFDAVRLLPAGSILEYDTAEDRLSITQYAPAPGAPSEGRTRRCSTWWRTASRTPCGAAPTTARRGPTGCRCPAASTPGPFLRAVPSHVSLTTVSLGMPGSMDHDAAAMLSAMANRRHHQHMLDQAFLATFEENLRQMVRLTDGHYLDQGIVMTTLPLYRELGVRTLLRGHAGELCHMRKAYAFSLDAEGERIGSDAALRTWLLGHLTDYMIGSVDLPVLSPRMGTDVREVAARGRRCGPGAPAVGSAAAAARLAPVRPGAACAAKWSPRCTCSRTSSRSGCRTWMVRWWTCCSTCRRR